MSSRASSRSSSTSSSLSSTSSYTSSKRTPSLKLTSTSKKSRTVRKVSQSSHQKHQESVVKMLCIRLPTPPESAIFSTSSSSSGSSSSSSPASPPTPLSSNQQPNKVPIEIPILTDSSKIYWKRKNYLNSQQYIDSLDGQQQKQKQLKKDNNHQSTTMEDTTSNEDNNLIDIQNPIVSKKDNVTSNPSIESDLDWLVRQQNQLYQHRTLLDHLIENPSFESFQNHQLLYLEKTWIDQRQFWLNSKFSAIFQQNNK